MSEREENLQVLLDEVDWLCSVIHQVIASYLKHQGHEHHWTDIPVPDLAASASVYARQVSQWGLNIYERLALTLAIAPHFRPESLDIFLSANADTDRVFTEFGGVHQKGGSGFIPSRQTLMFLIAANDPLWRMHVFDLFSEQHLFAAEQIFLSEHTEDQQTSLVRPLILSELWLHYFLTGEKVRPELNPSFPASPITTSLDWPDLVLAHDVMQQVHEIRLWLAHGAQLMQEWGLRKKVKPGFRTLFYGPPGTGKTLTAALLGKSSGREVYRIDLSMIVSKYIGETEKNLGKVFDVASYKDWILFFDEADALFGKRTQENSSNDRHANQQTGYLLQRIEDFPGTVVLASNLKSNLDEAFTRRFQSMIHFTMPAADQRLQLWKNAFYGVCELASDIHLDQVAENYELAGGAIINVLRTCALQLVSRNSRILHNKELIQAIKREFAKEHRTI